MDIPLPFFFFFFFHVFQNDDGSVADFGLFQKARLTCRLISTEIVYTIFRATCAEAGIISGSHRSRFMDPALGSVLRQIDSFATVSPQKRPFRNGHRHYRFDFTFKNERIEVGCKKSVNRFLSHHFIPFWLVDKRYSRRDT